MVSRQCIFLLSLLFLVCAIPTGSQTCCLAPSESTAVAGESSLVTVTLFNQTLSDTSQHSFDALTVLERSGGAGTNGCFWAGSGLTQNPTVSGGSWVVGGGDVSGQHNHWGFDNIGYDSTTVLSIRQNGPAHGLQLPCRIVVYQAMDIECNDATTFYNYQSDVITQTIYSDHVINCRSGVCDTIMH